MKEVLYCDNRGQLFTYREAMEIFRNKYDGKDPLNSVPFEEYFTKVIFQFATLIELSRLSVQEEQV